MADNFSTCLRFNLNEPEYRKAWEVLKKSKKSYSKTIVEALNEYDERHSRLKKDPFFESREREDKFVEQIVTAVESALDKALPTFLSAVLFNMIQPYGTEKIKSVQSADISTQNTDDTAESDVDWDFFGRLSFTQNITLLSKTIPK